MDAKKFATMLSDKRITDLAKMKHRYKVDIPEFISLLQMYGLAKLPLKDRASKNLVYMKTLVMPTQVGIKALLTPFKEDYGLDALEDEIISTLTIEDVDFSRDSVRSILAGANPKDDKEARVAGMKIGLEFIADKQNVISEENIYALYKQAILPFVDEGDRLSEGAIYRHDEVFVAGGTIEDKDEGVDADRLPQYMGDLVDFIAQNDLADDLLVAAVLHFYVAYLHPYFDGNGRMARLMQLWYLIQKGYKATLFIPFSSFIEKSRQAYYKSFRLIRENRKLSKLTDITPFLLYMREHVYARLPEKLPEPATIEAFEKILSKEKITPKEHDLWSFVLSAYGTESFSTKQLEKDFGNAAYATIRAFVRKFTALGLLTEQKYGVRNRYRLS